MKDYNLNTFFSKVIVLPGVVVVVGAGVVVLACASTTSSSLSSPLFVISASEVAGFSRQQTKVVTGLKAAPRPSQFPPRSSAVKSLSTSQL